MDTHTHNKPAKPYETWQPTFWQALWTILAKTPLNPAALNLKPDATHHTSIMRGETRIDLGPFIVRVMDSVGYA